MNILKINKNLKKHNHKQLTNKLPKTLPLNKIQTNFI